MVIYYTFSNASTCAPGESVLAFASACELEDTLDRYSHIDSSISTGLCAPSISTGLLEDIMCTFHIHRPIAGYNVHLPYPQAYCRI